MDLDGLLDPASIAGIVEDAVDRALDALALALAARDAAAGSASGAAASLAKVQALAAGLGVTTRWVGLGQRQLQVMGPDGTWGPASGDLGGQKGDPGASPVLRAGSKTTGALAVSIDNADPLNPLLNMTIPPGDDGWSPVVANVADGGRRVQRVVDWTGGTGAKPQAGLYVGAAGLVADIAAAVDMRGAPGPSSVSFVAASTTPLPIALGAVQVVLSAATAAAYAPSLYQALVSAADPRNAMVGTLTGYDPVSGTLSLAIQQAAGSGTHADWIVTSSPPLFVPSGVDGGYAGDPTPLPGATPVYGASTPAGSGVDGGYA